MVERREAMPHSRSASQTGAAQGFEMERKYSVPSNPDFRSQMMSGAASEDLHAWSIYRYIAFFFNFILGQPLLNGISTNLYYNAFATKTFM